MPETPPSPFKLNQTRILILVLAALALTFIIGSIAGVPNYQQLREARDAALSSSEAPSSAPN
jgi:hypothetical protein